jgi:hypothetical protein
VTKALTFDGEIEIAMKIILYCCFSINSQFSSSFLNIDMSEVEISSTCNPMTEVDDVELAKTRPSPKRENSFNERTRAISEAIEASKQTKSQFVYHAGEELSSMEQAREYILC